MPNGHDEYNTDWCKDKHEKLDSRIDKLDDHIWKILLTLYVNLFGVIGILISLWIKSGINIGA